MDLRRAMEGERAKREAMIAGAVDGSLWKNGQSGLLRGNYRNKERKGKEAGTCPDAGGSRATSGRSSQGSAGDAAAGSTRASSARAESAGGGGGGVRGSSGRRSADAKGASSAAAAAEPSMGDAGLTGSRIQPNGGPPRRAAMPMGFGKQEADVMEIHHGTYDDEDEDEGVGGMAWGTEPADNGTYDDEDEDEGVGGMACGTEASDGLNDGRFNEADSHRSFLDALNEWRNANKPATTEASGEAGASTSGRPSSGRPASTGQMKASTSATEAMECQTETAVRRPARPQSASNKSYFGKLVLSTHSRQAGQAAGGGCPLDPRPSSARPASSGGRPPLPPGSSIPSSSAPGGGTSDGGAATPAARDASYNPLDEPEPPNSTQNPRLNAAMEMLAKLEAMEKRNVDKEKEEDVDDGRMQTAEVSNAKGVGLTKATRLPDAIFVPHSDGDDSDE
eukprot:gene31855-7061_t